MREENSALKAEIQSLKSAEDTGETSATVLIPNFFATAISRISAEDVEKARRMSAQTAIVHIVEIIYFGDTYPRNVYMKSVKHDTMEVFVGGTWAIFAKHEALDTMVRRAGDVLLNNYGECEQFKDEMQSVLTSEMPITHTFQQKVMGIMWTTTCQPYHRVRQSLWALIQTRGKRS